jgi:ABC-type branched-subunit amino acid transport system permease subunit
LVGAAFFVVFREALALRPELVELHLLIFGVIFILVVLAFPGGLVEALHGLRRRASLQRASRAAGANR